MAARKPKVANPSSLIEYHHLRFLIIDAVSLRARVPALPCVRPVVSWTEPRFHCTLSGVVPHRLRCAFPLTPHCTPPPLLLCTAYGC